MDVRSRPHKPSIIRIDIRYLKSADARSRLRYRRAAASSPSREMNNVTSADEYFVQVRPCTEYLTFQPIPALLTFLGCL